jgi:Alpha/beta hydrolase domain
MSSRALVVLVGVVLHAIVASADVPIPSVEGPVTGGLGAPFVVSTGFDLAEVGYEQAEYFLSGTATAFTSATALTSDGFWTVSPGETAAYKTRIVVYRPASKRKFNGTVVVEWLNVSGGLDTAPDWIGAHTELIRDGFAWVGVSAQFTGVEGGGAFLPIVDLPLKTVDPARYGSLVHPGDSFSYDMFSQAGQALRHPTGVSPLGDLEIKRMIAAGESQSAFRLVTYLNGIHPLAPIYDGFLVHSRAGFGTLAPLSEPPQASVDGPSRVLIRTDLQVPVLVFQTETDLTFLNFYTARQPDTDRLRLWEVAGTAHADTYLLTTGGSDRGNSPAAADIVITSVPVAIGAIRITCGAPVNSGPQHYVLNAAFAALNRWVRTGKPPPSAPLLEVDAGPPRAITVDARGNGVGGIRTPQVDVPIATYGGEQDGGDIVCRLFGTTSLLDAPTLATLYPTHRAYVSAFTKALKKATRAGHVLRPDAKLLKRWAANSNVGR